MNKVTTAGAWSAEAIEATLAAQGIALASGRAERLARGQAALLGAAAMDPVLGGLQFDADATGFAHAISRLK
jgi:hypothetical protein